MRREAAFALSRLEHAQCLASGRPRSGAFSCSRSRGGSSGVRVKRSLRGCSRFSGSSTRPGGGDLVSLPWETVSVREKPPRLLANARYQCRLRTNIHALSKINRFGAIFGMHQYSFILYLARKVPRKGYVKRICIMFPLGRFAKDRLMDFKGLSHAVLQLISRPGDVRAGK